MYSPLCELLAVEELAHLSVSKFHFFPLLQLKLAQGRSIQKLDDFKRNLTVTTDVFYQT